MIQVGYFGKTIHRGDFLRFNLPQSFVTVMDDWLQTVMTQGESAHGAEWAKIYSACDGFRFHLSPNIAGENAWLGVIVPSADKVGRRFPFCIAASISDLQPPGWAQPVLQEKLNQFAALVQALANKDYEFDNLKAQIAELSETLNDALAHLVQGNKPNGQSSDREGFAITTQGLRPESASKTILDTALRHSYFNYSVWNPITHVSVGNSLITSGLPDMDSAIALFDNTWDNSNASMLNASEHLATNTQSDAMVSENAHPSPQSDNGNAMQGDDQQSSTQESDIEVTKSDIESTHQQHSAAQIVEDLKFMDDSTTVPKPRIERLELDEDSTDDAPWD